MKKLLVSILVLCGLYVILQRYIWFLHEYEIDMEKVGA